MIDGVAGGGVDGIGAPVCAAFSLKISWHIPWKPKTPGTTHPFPKRETSS